MIDFRSDVLAPPAAPVLQAMVAAAKERPVFSRHEDGPLKALETEVSTAFGFEDALFLPTGTIANQIAIRLWCAPGEAILAEAETHLVANEAASVAGLNGAALIARAGIRGHLAPETVGKALRPLPNSAPERKLSLVWLENTHNRAGGTVMPGDWLGSIAATCAAQSVPIHLDGARVFDAAFASGVSLDRIAHGVSSLMVCLNKNPGAPHGAMLLGARDFIAEAVRVQKMFGALWRPVSLLAAGARSALQNWRERVEISHLRARALADRLRDRLPAGAAIGIPDTNIVMLELGSEPEVRSVLEALARRGIYGAAYRRGRIRLVTHAGISEGNVTEAAETLVSVLTEHVSASDS